ncbi:glycosyltransferase [Candidatus Micrarchaeota archaeon]|nr:glycosyltransferase [Candidatus Micrarchaeota archaeon]
MQKKERKPLVSIIIPAYNAQATIGRVLNALERQDYPNYEVIVVDDSTNKGVCKQVEGFGFAKYVRNESNLGLSRSINKGIRIAKGKIVIALHDDCVPLSRKWISLLVSGFNNPKVGVVIGEHIIDFDSLSWVNKTFSYVYGLGRDVKKASKKGFEKTTHLGDKCDAYQRNVLEEVGGFDESFKFANEDTDLSKKILAKGYSILLCHDAKVMHIFSETERQSNLSTHFKKAFQLTRQSIRVFLRHGSNYKLDGALAIITILLSVFTNSTFFWVAFFLVCLLFHRVFSLFWLFSLVAIYSVGVSIPFVGAVISLLYFTLKSAFKGARYFMDYRKVDLVPSIFVCSFVWDLLAGIGWITGFFIFLKEGVSIKR